LTGLPTPCRSHRVHHGALQIEQERIAELVDLGVVGAVAADPAEVRLVAADAVLLQLGEDVAQRLLPDLADGAGRQLVLIALLLDCSRHLRAVCGAA